MAARPAARRLRTAPRPRRPQPSSLLPSSAQPSSSRPLGLLRPLAPLLTWLALTVPLPGPAPAQSGSGATPAAIDVRGLSPAPCKRIGGPGPAVVQPLRIQPSQVAAKNARGCLSAADALYGPDGCPVRFCGKTPLLQQPKP